MARSSKAKHNKTPVQRLRKAADELGAINCHLVAWGVDEPHCLPV